MPHIIQIEDALETKLRKLKKKDKTLYDRIAHKIVAISKNPELGKPLRNVLKGKQRIQIGPFVLMYTIDDENNTITFLEFDHHDKVYRKKKTFNL